MDFGNHPRCPVFTFPKLSNPFFSATLGSCFISQKDFSVVQLFYYWWIQVFAGKSSSDEKALIPKCLAGFDFGRAALFNSDRCGGTEKPFYDFPYPRRINP
jgi:hypothetical protein